jgi:hypothetical protein
MEGSAAEASSPLNQERCLSRKFASFSLQLAPHRQLTAKLSQGQSERLVALMMEAVKTSETLVNLHQATLLYNPQNSPLHHRENHKT